MRIMTVTRSVLLLVALASAGPTCSDRSTEHQTIARPEQAGPPAAAGDVAVPQNTAPAEGTERAPLATEPRAPASPMKDDVMAARAPEERAAPPANHALACAPEVGTHARQPASTDAELREVIHQVQARMDGEMARANGVIRELQRTNAELRRALAAEREQLADLRKRLTTGRSIALQ